MTSTISASPSPSGLNNPSCTASMRLSSLALSRCATASSTSLRWTCAIRAGVLARERGGVGAADAEVAGVEADRRGGLVEQPLDVGRLLEQRAGVGVDRQREPVGPHDLLEPGQVVGDAAPFGAVERERGRPVDVGDDGGVEDLGAGGGEQGGHAVRLGAGGLEVGGVEDERDEAADEPEAVAVEDRGQLRRVGGEPADGPELGGPQAEARHLAEHAVGRELAAPPGDLADAPGDRRAGQARHVHRPPGGVLLTPPHSLPLESPG